MIYRQMAERYQWTREQVNELTMTDLRLYLCDMKEIRGQGDLPRTKLGWKALESTFERAAANLIAGRRWDA